MGVIGRFSIHPHALDVPTEGGPTFRSQNRRLAEIVLEFGRLSLLGPKDADELRAAIRAQADALGFDFWRPLLRAIESSGPGAYFSKPHLEKSLRELCDAGELVPISEHADLVVVGGSEPRVPGLDPAQEQALYEVDGHSTVGTNFELALPSAVDHSATIRALKALRGETVIATGTPRADLWEGYFAPLARASTEVNIFDGYLFSGLVKAKSFAGDIRYLLWLLDSLDAELPDTARINIFARSGEWVAKRSHKPGAQAYSIDDIASCLKGLRRWDRPDSLHLYVNDSLDHDRHIRFNCGHAVTSQAGFDHFRFRDGKLSKPFSYAYVRPGESLDRRETVEREAKRSARHWVLKSAQAGFEEILAPPKWGVPVPRPPARRVLGS